MNKKYNSILVPFDGSDYSKKALDEAIIISKMSNASILLLNVVNESIFKENPSLFSGYLRGTTTYDRNISYNMIDQRKSWLEGICFDATKNIKISNQVIVGNPKKEILKFAKDNKIDLIVIGSQGLGGIKKLKILGSVSRTVIENALCPVLVVHI